MKEKHYIAPAINIIHCSDHYGQILAASCGSYTEPESVKINLSTASETNENVEFNAKSHSSSVWDDDDYGL